MTINKCFHYGKESLAQYIFMTWGMDFSEDLFKKGKRLPKKKNLNVGIQFFIKSLVKIKKN